MDCNVPDRRDQHPGRRLGTLFGTSAIDAPRAGPTNPHRRTIFFSRSLNRGDCGQEWATWNRRRASSPLGQWRQYAPPEPTEIPPFAACAGVVNNPLFWVRRFVSVPSTTRLGAFEFSITALCGKEKKKKPWFAIPDEVFIVRMRGPQIIIPRGRNLGNGTQVFSTTITIPGVYLLEISTAQMRYNWSRLLLPNTTVERDMRPFIVRPITFFSG